jgi:hypothetical protein
LVECDQFGNYGFQVRRAIQKLNKWKMTQLQPKNCQMCWNLNHGLRAFLSLDRKIL